MNKVKVGDLVLAKTYVKVTEVGVNKQDPQIPEIIVSNVDRDQRFLIRGNELIDELDSADLVEKTTKVTMTELAKILSTSHETPFTVNFNKQLTIKDIKSGKERGTERTLRGKLIAPEPLLGRSQVEDLDIAEGEYRFRSVDHRSINWLIVDGTRYELGKPIKKKKAKK
jgi:hypothetical protein